MRHCTLLLLSAVTVFGGGRLRGQDNTTRNEQRERPDYFAQYFTLSGVEFTKEQQLKVDQLEKQYRPNPRAEPRSLRGAA